MKLVRLACLCIHCCGGKQGLKGGFPDIALLKVLLLVGVALSHYFTLFEVFFKDPFPNPPTSLIVI